MEETIIDPNAPPIAARVCASPIIYGLRDPGDRSKTIRYVGYTRFPQERLAQHTAATEGSNPGLQWWLRGLRKAGLRPEMVVIEFTDFRRWARAERYWIKLLRASETGHLLLNIEAGGVSRRHRQKKPKSGPQKKRKRGKKPPRKPPPLSRWSPLLGSGPR